MENAQDTIKPHWINRTSPLFVVQHQPESNVISKTGIIILNSGFLHNVGPYRLSIDIANILSSFGFVVIRVDQSGKGDSPPRHDIVGLDAKLADFDDVYENLRMNFGITNCILIGLCSGADDGLEIANQRKSVSGLVFLDGFCPVTIGYYANHYFTRLRYIRSWLRWKQEIRKQNKRIQTSSKKSQANIAEYTSGMSLRRWQSESTVKSMYESILKRGTKVMAVFSGDTGDYYNHQGQLLNGIKSPKGILHEIYFREATHIYTNHEYRIHLVESIGNWIASEFNHK